MGALGGLLGTSPAMSALRGQVTRLLSGCSIERCLPPVLIQGETGTGKGLLARTLHDASPRVAGPFVALNCAAIPDTLLEAELFGVERGAFTGAVQSRPGLFEAADSGTLLLDEVGALPLAGQAKLLTAIEDHLVRPLGAVRARRVDAWIIAATSEDLHQAIATRHLRQDLYHRLAAILFALPPLRDRGSDILELAEHFLAEACAAVGRPLVCLGSDAREALLRHPWPGNVRELANTMERVALFSEAPVVTAATLALRGPAAPGRDGDEPTAGPGQPRETFERARIIEALEETRWNVVRAAELLRVPRTNLRRRMARYHLCPPDGPIPRTRRTAADGRRPSAPDTRSRHAALPAAPPRWERRPVAFLAVVVVRDPAAGSRRQSARALDTLLDRAQEFEAHVVRTGLRRLVAAFGVQPIADAPVRAIQAAFAMQRAIHRLSEATQGGLGLTAALHLAPVLVSPSATAPQLALDEEDPAWGVLDALLARAEPNAVVASAAAAPFLERAFLLDAITPATPERIPAFRIRRRSSDGGVLAGRPPSRFVGREHELAVLEARLATVEAGHGQVVGIIGEPGIGKSRLLLEFRRRLRSAPIRYLEGHCVASGQGTPYGPLLDLARSLCGIDERTDEAEVIARVAARLVRVGLDAEAAPYLHHLLRLSTGATALARLSAEAIRFRTFDILRQLWLRTSLERPLVLAVEDLHWVDATSEALLASMVDALPGARVLLCVTYRPGYQPPWMGRSHASQLALSRLSPDESLHLARSLLDADPGDRLAEQVVPRAAGNPFFLEELVRAVGDAADGDGAARVPDTVEAAILARLQQLPAAESRLLKTAAVLGRQVSTPLLREVSGDPDAVDAGLHELVTREFLRVQPGAPEDTHVFAHVLTQEVVYEQLDESGRARLHEAAGRALERLFEGRLDGVLDHLAHHYGLSADHEKAVAYLTRAADRAAGSYALAEALATLERALGHAELLTGLERERQAVAILIRHALPMLMLGRLGEGRDLLLRHWPRVERLRDPALSGPYCFQLAHILSHLGQGDEAAPWAEQALREAARCGDAVTQGRARYALSMNAFLTGRSVESVDHGQSAVALLRASTDRHFFGVATWLTGFGSICLGRFADAMAMARETRDTGDRTGDPRTQCYADMITGWAQACLGDVEQGLTNLQRSLNTAPDPLAALVVRGPLGFAQLEAGQREAAVESLERSASACRQVGMRHYGAWMAAWLGEAYLAAGHPERARSLGEQALAQGREVGFPLAVGVAQRLLGRLAAAAGAHDEAAKQLEEAVHLFSALEARYEVARTQLDLAVVARSQGHIEAAAGHLREARASFEALGVPYHAARATKLAREIVGD